MEYLSDLVSIVSGKKYRAQVEKEKARFSTKNEAAQYMGEYSLVRELLAEGRVALGLNLGETAKYQAAKEILHESMSLEGGRPCGLDSTLNEMCCILCNALESVKKRSIEDPRVYIESLQGKLNAYKKMREESLKRLRDVSYYDDMIDKFARGLEDHLPKGILDLFTREEVRDSDIAL